MKPWFKMIGLFLLIVLIIGGIYGYNVYKMVQGFKNTKPPVQTVSTIVVKNESWSKTLTAVGNLRAEKSADLNVEASGVVEEINYKSGDNVAKGAVILTLRRDEDKARLANYQANARLAQANFERDTQQLAINAISKQTFEASRANRDITAALVSEHLANINKKILRAPFSGTLGIITPNVGQLISPSSVITSLQAVDSLYVDFSMPQSALAVLKVGQKVLVESDVVQKKYSGLLIAIDSKVDSDTRNINVRAKINNDDKKLLSGMFVNVGIELDSQAEALVLPQTAVNFSPYGQTVFVVTTAGELYDEQIAKLKKDGATADKIKDVKEPVDRKAKVVRQEFVTTGAKRGDQVTILKGVAVGDEVVTSGQVKIKNGTLIKVNNQVLPENDPTPSIKDE